MKDFKRSGAEWAKNQEVRITALIQLVFCFLALFAAVRRDLHTNQKRRKQKGK